MVRRTHQTLWVLFAVFIAYLVVVRLFITWAQLAPQQLADSVGWLTDSEIVYEQLDIQQSWWGLELSASELLVEHQGWELEVEQVEFDLSFLAILVPKASIGEYLRIRNLVVLDYQLKSDESTEQSDSMSQSNWVFEPEKLKSTVDISRLWKQVSVEYLRSTFFYDEHRFSIHIDQFEAFKGQQWSLASDFRLYYDDVLQGERFQFKAQLQPGVIGNVERGHFSIQSYDRVNIKHLARFFPAMWHDRFPEGGLIPTVEGKITHSLVSDLDIALSAEALHWEDKSHLELPKSIGLHLTWQNQSKIYDGSDTKWSFLVNQIELDHAFVETMSPIDVQLLSRRVLLIETQQFDIKPFKPIFQAFLYQDDLSQLVGSSVELSLANVRGILNVRQLAFEELELDVQRFAVPVTNFPGIALQNIHLKKQATAFEITSPNPIWVMAPDIHPIPMSLSLNEPITGELDWTRQAWRIEQLSVLLDGMPVDLEASGDLSGKLDLKGLIAPESVRSVTSHLPYAWMSPTLQEWLKQALNKGKVGEGRFYFNGELSSEAFASGRNQFGLDVALAGADLQFQPNWPKLTNMDVEIRLRQFDMDITAQQLQLAPGVMADNVTATLNGLNQEDIALNLSATVSGEAQLAIGYLSQTPLLEKVGLQDMLANSSKVEVQGNVEVSLDSIWIPLYGYDNQSERVKGRVDLKDTDINLFEVFKFEGLKGAFAFTEESLQADKLTGLFEDGPVILNVKTKKGVMIFDATGRANLDKPSLVKGQADWSAQFKVPVKTEGDPLLSTQVDLAKLDWLMPAPLNKTHIGNSASIDLFFDEDGFKARGFVENHNSFNLQFLTGQNQLALTRGKVLFAPENTLLALPDTGVEVKGLLSEVDLDGWFQWSPPQWLLEDKEESWFSKTEWATSGIAVKQMRLFDQVYPSLNMDWKGSHNKSLVAELQSLQMDISVVKPIAGPIRVETKRLWLKLQEVSEGDSESVLSEQERQAFIKQCQMQPPSMMHWPDITFTGENLKINDIGINWLSFDLGENGDTLHFKRIQGVLAGKAGNVSGDYFYHKEPGLSSANLQLRSTNVSALSKLLGLKKGFSGKKANVQANLSWWGGIECFNLLGLLGKTQFKVEEGVIEDVEPGFARLLGLLSITSLARRLSLDLKDVTGKGFAYDSIKGETHFMDGAMQFRRFELDAPSAGVNMDGSVDIIRRRFDLEAKVTPALGSSLPALSALTGVATPLGALAIYTLMKVIPDINEELVTYNYKITGPWLDPNIEGDKPNNKENNVETIEEILDRQ